MIAPQAVSDIDVLTNLALERHISRLTNALRSVDRGHPAIASQQGRLENGLREWRETPVSSAQRRLLDSSNHENDRIAAKARWAKLLAARPDLPFLAELVPHRGTPGPLRVLVLLGGGGLGDALMFSAVFRELKRRLAPCEIILCYAKPVVQALYARSLDVDHALSAPWDLLQEVGDKVRWLGIFDIFVDIFCFLPRLLVCEGSRVDLDRHGAWLAGNAALSDLIDRFSHNLGMNLLDRALKVHVFDILASVSGLPLNASSPLAFTPDPAAIRSVEALGLKGPYVTVRDGCSPGDIAVAGQYGADRTTKQLSESKWVEVCSALRQLDVMIVQVGDKADPKLKGADIDLRGKTTLSELCFVFKASLAHVDTEGGLAHFARASNSPAYVFFGTTSADFFGYPQNVNLTSAACGCCWYCDDRWLATCPRGTVGPVCTESIDLDPLVNGLQVVRLRQSGPAASIHVLRALAGDARVDDMLELNTSGKTLAGFHPLITARLVPGSDFDLCEFTVAASQEPDVFARGSAYNMPVNDGVIGALMLKGSTWPQDLRLMLSEMLRVVVSGGVFVAEFHTGAASPEQKTMLMDFLTSLDTEAAIDVPAGLLGSERLGLVLGKMPAGSVA